MKIAAVFGIVGLDSPKAYVERMCRAQIACEWHTHDVFEVEGGAIGIVHTSEKFSKIPMLVKGKTGNILAVSGAPTKNGSLRRLISRIVEMSTREASQALAEMNGAFAAIFWHEAERKSLLVTDFMGFQPIYLCKARDGIALASEIKAFSVGNVVPVTPDPAGWGAFVIFGNTIGGGTQLSGVSRLRGVKLDYDISNNTFVCDSYWKWPNPQSKLSSDNVPVAPIVDCFRKDVEAYREYGSEKNTLLMSSGLDSRLLLCLLTEERLPIDTMSVQQPSHFWGAEGKLGQEVAKRFGISNAQLVSPSSGREGQIESLRYMAMNDVALPGLSLFISKVAGHVGHLQGAIWEGWASGNIATQLTHRDMDTYLCETWGLYPRSNVWSPAEDIFSNQFLMEVQERFYNVLKEERSVYGNDDFGIKRFIIKNRALNRTIPNPLKVYSNTVIPFIPGTSRATWEMTAVLPPYSANSSKRLIKRIFLEIFPEAARYRFCSESGLYTANDCFDLSVSSINLFYDLLYKWERRHKIPYVGRFIAQKTRNNTDSRDNNLQRVVLERLKYDKTYLNITKIKTLLSQESLNPQQRKSKRLLFYWVLWNLVMSGEVTSNSASEWITGK